MLFNSIIFFVFLAIVLPCYYFLKTKQSKNLLLLVASYVFYGYWDWRFCFLLAASTGVDYVLGHVIHESENPKKRKKLLLLSLFFNLGMLAFFKYFNFFTDSFQEMISIFGYRLDALHLNIILPMGMSFYTFQTMSYIIDVYNKKLKPCDNAVDFALFVSFFPQLVAGPIERAAHLLPQIQCNNRADRRQWSDGVTLIVYGLFKKVLIGDTCGRFVDHIFGNLPGYASWECLCACILFSIQIYADFSGYSNVARGTAKLLGFELSPNFIHPYLSSNIEEFWRRWHITLSTWLRDYLYIPLGGSRNGTSKTYRNLMITMLLGGLWHGAGWNFIIWGGLHGLYLVVYKAWFKDKTFRFQWISILITFILTTFAFVIFRTKGMDDIYVLIDKFTAFSWGSYPLRFLSILLSFSLIVLILDLMEKKWKTDIFINNIKSLPVRYALLTVMFGGTVICILLFKAQPFIYFQF